MKKKMLPIQQPPQPKAIMTIVDAFVNTFSPVMSEDEADDYFTVAKLREYFNAWPVPKMPDPLPPYIKELGERGFLMITGYDGRPAIFVRKYISQSRIVSMPLSDRAEQEYDEDISIEEEEDDEDDPDEDLI